MPHQWIGIKPEARKVGGGNCRVKSSNFESDAREKDEWMEWWMTEGLMSGTRLWASAMCDQSHWENDDVWSDPTPWQKNPWSLEKPSQPQRGEDHWKMKPFRLIIRPGAGKCIDQSGSAFHTSQPLGSDFIKWSHGFRWQGGSKIWSTPALEWKNRITGRAAGLERLRQLWSVSSSHTNHILYLSRNKWNKSHHKDANLPGARAR